MSPLLVWVDKLLLFQQQTDAQTLDTDNDPQLFHLHP